MNEMPSINDFPEAVRELRDLGRLSEPVIVMCYDVLVRKTSPIHASFFLSNYKTFMARIENCKQSGVPFERAYFIPMTFYLYDDLMNLMRFFEGAKLNLEILTGIPNVCMEIFKNLERFNSEAHAEYGFSEAACNDFRGLLYRINRSDQQIGEITTKIMKK